MNIIENIEAPKKSVIVWGILLVLALLFAISTGFHRIAFPGNQQISETSLIISRLLYWLTLLIIWQYAVKIEKQALLIWGNKWNNFLTYFLSVIAMAATIIIASGAVSHLIAALLGHTEKSAQLAQMVEIFRNNRWLLALTLLTAGVTEELIFRGYLLPRFAVFFNNPYIAVFVSSLLFAFVHAGYGTIENMAGPFIIGAVFAIHYLKYRNIVFLIVFHFLWDMFAFFALFRMQH
jgi:membrane protease YdiL (CAAX protease family)